MKTLVKLTLIMMFFTACTPQQYSESNRLESIPTDIAKMSPETDLYPPILHSDEFESPIPLPGPINTPGGEDSFFIPSDGENVFYVFFTPDVRIPVEGQVLDGVTGIYYAHLTDGVWTEPQRVWLQKPGKLALDGCLFGHGDNLIFCTVREGLSDIHWFTAERAEPNTETWRNWQMVEFPPEYEVGELHISNDGNTLYFHSDRPGGVGERDIWISQLVDGDWQEPINLSIINSEVSEGWPALSHDESELWFTRWYQGTPAIYRSKKESGAWGAPEMILSQFAGEPTLDADGNLYFTHHYYKDAVMLEADIYVVHRK